MAQHVTLCVDPGKYAAGVALFYRKELQSATCLVIKHAEAEHLVQTTQRMTYAIADWVSENIYHLPSEPTRVVVEFPQVYTRDKSKGDPNSLLPLAALCGAVVAHYDCESVPYLPRTWKGTIGGDIMTRRIEGLLRERGETALVQEHRKTYRHNAIDAVGIGYHHLGILRFDRVITR